MITLQELKQWIETLPESANDFDIVHAEFGYMEDGERGYRKDTPVSGFSIDEETNEILFIR
jgi:hypothetical protein